MITLGGYVAVSIGRVHQLLPVLEPLHLGVVTGVAVVALLFALRKPGHEWPRLSPDWRFFVTGMLVWTLLTVPTSVYPGLSFRWWSDVIVQSWALAVIVAMVVRSVRDVHRLVAVFVLSVAFYSFIILLRFGVDLNVRFGELYSYDTNDFAQVVVCALPLAIYLALDTKRIIVRISYGLLVGLFLIIIIKSGSRGAFVGLVTVGAGALVAWRAVSMKWRLATVVAGVSFMAVVGSGMFLARVATLGDVGEDYNITESSGRVEAWKRGIGYMMSRPILGVGVGAFGVAEGTLSELAIAARTRGGSVKWMAPHSSLVQIGAESGFPGLILFCGFLVVVFSESRGLARGKRGKPLELLGGALFLSLTGYLVTALFLSQAYAALLYFLAGLIGGVARLVPPTQVGDRSVTASGTLGGLRRGRGRRFLPGRN